MGTGAHLLSVLASPDDWPRFKQNLETLRQDIARARQHHPDVIIALPHMGTQFSHESDRFSRIWAKRMLQEGVDIVLSDHTHSVQPIEYHRRDVESGKPEYGLIVYCPGNFVNEYRERDGDAAAIVNIHLSTGGADKKGDCSARQLFRCGSTVPWMANLDPFPLLTRSRSNNSGGAR